MNKLFFLVSAVSLFSLQACTQAVPQGRAEEAQVVEKAIQYDVHVEAQIDRTDFTLSAVCDPGDVALAGTCEVQSSADGAIASQGVDAQGYGCRVLLTRPEGTATVHATCTGSHPAE